MSFVSCVIEGIGVFFKEGDVRMYIWFGVIGKRFRYEGGFDFFEGSDFLNDYLEGYDVVGYC